VSIEERQKEITLFMEGERATAYTEGERAALSIL